MRIKITLVFLICLFSIPTFAQVSKIQGEWNVSEFWENEKVIYVDSIVFKPRISPTKLSFNNPGVYTDSVAVKSRDKLKLIVRFSKGNFNFNGACNHTRGKYSFTKGIFKFASMITTVKHCEKEMMDLDHSLRSVFSKITKYTIKQDILTFHDKTGQKILVMNRLSK